MDEDNALSDEQIYKIFREHKKYKIQHPNIIEMDKITKYKNINQIFNNQGHAIVFIRYPGEKIGHWTTLLRHDGEIYFFDSLGYSLNHYDKQKYISKLAKKEGYKVRSNRIKFQSDDTNVCGRYSLMMAMFNKLHLSNDDIDKLLKHIKREYKNIDNFLLECRI